MATKNIPIKSIITITEEYEEPYVTYTIVENGTLLYSQKKPLYMMAKSSTYTFLDVFLRNLNMSEGLDETHNVVGDRSELFYFISQSRLQSLNFKQKFFYFLLKKIFFHGKSTSIEEITSFLVNNKVERGTGSSEIQF